MRRRTLLTIIILPIILLSLAGNIIGNALSGVLPRSSSRLAVPILLALLFAAIGVGRLLATLEVDSTDFAPLRRSLGGKGIRIIQISLVGLLVTITGIMGNTVASILPQVLESFTPILLLTLVSFASGITAFAYLQRNAAQARAINRRRFLAQLQNRYSRQLDQALAGSGLFTLRFRAEPDAVAPPKTTRPVEMDQQLSNPADQLSEGTLYDASGGHLLLLGMAGTGKTTLLIQLALDLLTRARSEPRAPVPVVFNLSSWRSRRLALDEWLAENLSLGYNIPRRLAQEWIRQEAIVPLLDGLDEVPDKDDRTYCVTAINTFLQVHPHLPLIVSSRTIGYVALPVRLMLTAAFSILPLTQEQLISQASRWGDPISNDRKAELEARLHTSRANDGDNSFPFAGFPLSGADVFYLAALTLAGPNGDVQAAVDALRASREDLNPRPAVNLSGLHIEEADLRKAHLAQAALTDAHLERVDLSEAHLDGADLSGTRLLHAKLVDAHLEQALLSNADLSAADLGRVHLERAILSGALLQQANLMAAHLEQAHLDGAHLEGASLGMASAVGTDFSGAYLKGADLSAADLKNAAFFDTHLEGTDLSAAHLESAALFRAHLEGAKLDSAHLEGADLFSAHLERASLERTVLDIKTVLQDASLADIRWDGADLTVVDWSRVTRLGDERSATWRDGLDQHWMVVRAYRQLASRLRNQGLTEDADRFAYKAQVRRRGVLLRQRRIFKYLGSWVLAILAGYGYRPERTIALYLLTVVGFMWGYLQVTHGVPLFGLYEPAEAKPLLWYEALVLSVGSFHGRGFFPQGINLGDPVAILAAAEAVIGLLIEISFIATFTQRYFGAK